MMKRIVLILVLLMALFGMAWSQGQSRTAVECFVDGNEYLDKGDYDRAIAAYTEAMRLDSNYAVFVYKNRGFAYSRKGDYDRAIADYTQAIRLEPNYVMGYSNRGIAYFYKGDYDRAIADFETVLRFDPNFPNARQNLEYIRQQRGR